MNGFIRLAGVALLASCALEASAATFTVTTTNNSGLGSLRQAITDANGNAGADLIQFNIGSTVRTIVPASALPSITQPVTIDGQTQPGFAGTPLVEISGISAGSSSDGLQIWTSNCTIRALAINRFSGHGIKIATNGNNIVEGCVIGLDRTATQPQSNRLSGILITNSPNNRIGGSDSLSRNIVSANNEHGIVIGGITATNNVVAGNWVGINVNGVSAGNNGDGLRINGGKNFIGATRANIISGNTSDGVEVTSVAAATEITGNIIGLDPSGSFRRPNGGNGILITGSVSNRVGGVADRGNTISANGASGVQITAGTRFNVVSGNRIGTFDGNSGLGNALHGILIGGDSRDNTIGGTVPNIIAFNGADGVFVLTGTNNLVRANSIFQNEVLGIDLGAFRTTPNDLGDADTGANQLQNYPVIAAATNFLSIILISGGLNTRPNSAYTIDLYANAACDSGGYGEGEVHLGSTNVTTDDSGNATFTALLPRPGNDPSFITATATDAFGNTSEFSPCASVVKSNVRATFTVTTTNDSGPGSLRDALLQANASPGSDLVRFNITTPERGIFVATPLPPITDALIIDGTTQPGFAGAPVVRINGAATSAGANGLLFQSGGCVVRALSVEGFKANGILVSSGATGVRIGGTNSGEGNVITGNALNGIYVQDGSGVSILGNSISASGELAIDLASPGVSINDPGDSDSGPNGGQNFPIVTLAYGNGSQTVVEGTLNSAANASFIIEMFSSAACDSSGHGEGNTYLGRTRIITDASGNAVFSVPLAAAQFSDRITATATDTDGNTSEFSSCQRVVPFDSVDLSVSQTEPVDPSSSRSNLVYTVTVANTGPTNATAVALTDTLPRGMTLISSLPSQGSCGLPIGGVVQCNLGTITKGGQATVIFTVSPLAHGPATNSVTASASEFDSVPGNNSSAVVTLVGIAEIALSLQGAAGPLGAGASLTYVAVITNFGPDIATNIAFFGEVDPRFIISSVTPSQGACDVIGNVIDCTIPSAGVATVHITGRLIDVGTLLSSFNITSPEFDPNSANNFAVVQTEVIPGAGVFLFESTELTISEVDAALMLRVIRQAGTTGTITVNVVANSDTATAGSDFAAVSQVLTFTNGEAMKAISVGVIDDSMSECNETFFVRLTNSVGGVVAGPPAFVTIFDNDAVPEGTVRAMSLSGLDQSEQPDVSDEGGHVTFISYARNLVPNDFNSEADVFVYDRFARSNILASIDWTGSIAGNGFSGFPSISANGRYVAFESDASDLISNDNNTQRDVFVRDIVAGTTTLVSARAGGAPGNSQSYSPVISADGRYVAFVSLATDLTTTPDNNGAEDIFLRDLVAGTTRLISANAAGDSTANDDSFTPQLAADGSGNLYIGFLSDATDLVEVLDENGTVDIFVRDVTRSMTHLVSLNLSGDATANGHSVEHDVTITPSGHIVVAFTSQASDLVLTDTNDVTDIFARDINAAATTLVSRSPLGHTGNDASTAPSLSRDGRYVAFESRASDLVSGDGNGAYDIFVRDLSLNRTTLVTRNCSGSTSASVDSFSPLISTDGRFVVFSSVAPDLAPGDFSAGSENIYRHELVSGETTLISKNTLQSGGGGGHSFSPAISASSDAIAFASLAQDLVSNDNNDMQDVILWTTTIPRMSLVPTNNNNLVLRWPSDTPPQILETSSNSLNWLTATNTISSNAQYRTAIVSRDAAERSRYYRLRKQ